MIKISGSSDDLVEVDGCRGGDEFSSDNWSGDLIAPDGGQMTVSCWYGRSGTWHVGVGQVDDSIDFPSWPLKIYQGDGLAATRGADYSMVLEIDAPEGTRLTNIRPMP